jgi:hypothetical protein
LLNLAPHYTFNTNVFKSNVKLALTEEEIAADEA